MQKKLYLAIFASALVFTNTFAQKNSVTITPLAKNAVRVQYGDKQSSDFPDWLYVKHEKCEATDLKLAEENSVLTLRDAKGQMLTQVLSQEVKPSEVQGQQTSDVTLKLLSPEDEYLTGLGQFQDGLTNLHGVTRRLTQVNTQISIPLLISDRGYGILWNNYGMVDFNPASDKVEMTQTDVVGKEETVNVTSTEGGKNEVRRSNIFTAEVTVPQAGTYAILMDVGQTMARRHNLSIDDKVIMDVQNLWLPPTTSEVVELSAGTHNFKAELTSHDKPVIYYRKVDNTTTFHSPVAECLDYTLFVGTPDEIIATYRNLTGNSPMMPIWALGYTHCRERFHSSDEILKTARTFREKQMPIDIIVQDWQWWGKYGWNSMKFDEDFYPNPTALTDTLHKDLNMRLMLSVWSKIDKSSELGKQMKKDGYYIPGTDWIDFFNPNAANTYWTNFSKKLLAHNVDAWWQDATEPENDDLVGRKVWNGKYPGEFFRNVYPLLVSKTVYEGLRKDDPSRRAMILTRSGFPGIQRYGSTLWSGDVGNDWETLRRQITGGLGLMAAGHPWWTYDAGGFFRPMDQYKNQDYIQRMLRWVETATFLPLMRIHGYISNTEPWNYGDEAEQIIKSQLELRYRLLPYIYSCAADVTREGSTLMRPLLFDFGFDKKALEQKYEYMFGKSILVNPVTEPNVTAWTTYLPDNASTWYEFGKNQKYQGGQSITSEVTLSTIPVFVKGGSIVPFGPVKQYTQETSTEPMEILVYPGKDAEYSLYEDEGDNYNCENGAFSIIKFRWNEKEQKVTIENREGSFDGMAKSRQFVVKLPDGTQKTVKYNGRHKEVKF